MRSSRQMDLLFRRYYRPLCLYALHYLEDVSAAEDVVQDCFISFWEKAPETAPVRSYFYAMVKNRCIDILRATKPSAPLPEDLPEEQAVERSENEARLWTAIGQLPERRRQCLILSKRDGLSYKEIAEELGLSERTVRNHVARAMASLREGPEVRFVLMFF